MTTISDFDIFARVAKTGNMSAAGREIGISPAVVSKRISLLEERLGARLFQRTTRQLTLTETGEGYFKRVLEILNLVAEADDFVSRGNTAPRGTLKVTAPTAFARLHIAPLLPRFAAAYPEIHIDLELTDRFVDIVRDGFDLAIRIGELPDSSLVARKLAADKRIICAAPAYLERNGVPHTLADLDRHNCLSASAQDTWRLDGPDGATAVRIRGNLRSNSADLLREAVLAGAGLGLRSTWEIGDDLRRGALVPVLPAYRGSTQVAIYAVYPSREFMPAKVHALIDFLANTYAAEGATRQPDGRTTAEDGAALALPKPMRFAKRPPLQPEAG